MLDSGTIYSFDLQDFVVEKMFKIIMVKLFLISALYLIHLNQEWSPFSDPIESIMAMFMMSLGEFGDYFVTFKQTDFPELAKVIG